MADTLPTELIERILGLAASIDQPTALAVCLTNRLGRGAGQPVMYHTLDLGDDEHDEEEDEIEDANKNEDHTQLNPRVESRLLRWSLLCRTVVENRSLASRVLAIKAHLDSTSARRARLARELNRLPEPVYSVPALDVKAWKAFISTKLGLSTSRRKLINEWLDEWVCHVERQYEQAGEAGIFRPASSPDAYLGLLILACPRLRMLRTSGIPAERLCSIITLSHALYNKEFGQGTTGNHVSDGFSNVEEVFLNSEDSFLQDVGQILQWSSIKKFELDGICACSISHPSLGPAFESSLTEMRITDAMLSTSQVSILFTPCTQLKSFFMSWNNDCDVYRDVDWRDLGTALTACNPLLEDIYLEIAHEEDLRHPKFQGRVYNNFYQLSEVEQEEYLVVNNQGIGSLQGFTHLRKLSAPYIALFGVFDNVEERDHDWTLSELLPSSLEELDIFCEEIDFKETDLALLNAPGTSELRHMTIWNCTRDRWISKVHGEGRSG